MSREDCKFFDSCSAPLCPLDEKSLERGIWYPDEEVCRHREFRALQWVKTQKKIAGRGDPSTYFVLEMLDRNIIVRDNIKGLDPSKPLGTERAQLRKWLNSRKEIDSSAFAKRAKQLTSKKG